MTDITELAQSLKAAAEHYQSVQGIARYSKTADAKERFLELANPANILALVEALEKAQAQSSKWLEAYHKAVSIGARYEERIAELESRTVKLPKLKMLEDYLAEVAIEERKQILVGVKLEFHRALAAAGIKVEAE
ncbi:TPA: hypothetical protein L9Q10_001063 [Klebsiella pneumoniae]|nr:hypothetical protein NUBL515_48240 [Klebsiella pneumoniae]HBR2587946.1 hypothetical protein [Klebsiella pneumoniae]HBR5005564.1 hypothetical protein [Klebsiella pneumoniae]HBV2436342.1 hypothetical protein [Klebsiella pneumoniae]HCI7939406.1 hypothetical protein [Klebsiella pneumoniae]